MGYDDQNRTIRGLLPEWSGTFNVEQFKKEVLKHSDFEQQIRVFDKYFNLWVKRDLAVATMEGEKLFSIYCSCKVCKQDEAIYSSVKEELFKHFLAQRFKELKQKLEQTSNYVDKVLLAEKYFDVQAFGIIKPFEEAEDDYVISVAPKTVDERLEWTVFLLNRYNEDYFSDPKDQWGYYSKSYDYQRNDIDSRLDNALYPKELIEQEIEKVRSDYEKPGQDLKQLIYFKKLEVEQFRELVNGSVFDLIGFGKWNSEGLRKVLNFHKFCYLRYLEVLKQKHEQPLKSMPTNLSPDYNVFVKDIVKTFVRGFASKDTYTDIQERANLLGQEKAYLFYRQILEGLQAWLVDHRKAVGSQSVSKHAINVEQAIGSIQEMMLDYEPLSSTNTQANGSFIVNGLNNSQTVLLVYYLLKIFGLEPRKNLDVTQAAKVAHLLTGKEFTKINNSDFYQKFKAVPNFKQDKNLIEDLETIKPYFIKAQLPEAVKMIDNEIEVAKLERAKKI